MKLLEKREVIRAKRVWLFTFLGQMKIGQLVMWTMETQNILQILPKKSQMLMYSKLNYFCHIQKIIGFTFKKQNRESAMHQKKDISAYEVIHIIGSFIWISMSKAECMFKQNWCLFKLWCYDLSRRLQRLSYDNIILVSCVWWYGISHVMKRFLKGYDLSNKNVIVASLNAGWVGHSLADFQKLLPNSKMKEKGAFSKLSKPRFANG